MEEQVPVRGSARADEFESESVREVSPDLAHQRLAIPNAVYRAKPRSDAWVPMDVAVHETTEAIRRAAARAGNAIPAAATVETLGRFGRVGSLRRLAESSQVPIFAPPQDHPKPNGNTSSPPLDPAAGGGKMPVLSRFYPRGPIDLGRGLGPLPADRPTPVHIPVHRPGYVSPWSERDLNAADVLITTRRERVHAVARKPEVHRRTTYLR